MVMRIFYLCGAIGVIALGVRMQQKYNVEILQKKQMTMAEAGAVAAAIQPGDYNADLDATREDSNPDSDGAVAAAVVTSAKQTASKAIEVMGVGGDPLNRRVLNLALPATKRELFAKLSDFEDPMIPNTATEDADVKTIYRGFYEVEPGKFRRVEFHRVNKMYLSVEDANGYFPTWSEAKDEFNVNNFNEDRYSIVMTLRDLRVIYLKFYTGRKIPEYADPNFRVLSGWIVDGNKNRTARRMALIDSRKPELADSRKPGEFLWPRLGALQQLMPSAELAN